MSKRRKNAGAGYGYMFHGSFAKKADAVAKERKTKGAWIKSTLTNNGYRHIVMSPRTNPIKRKKKAPKETQGEMMKRRLAELGAYTPRPGTTPNPAEVLIMGANPHENVQEIVLQPGAKLVIRNNPTDARANSLGTFLGFSPSHPSKKELAESRRGFKRRVRSQAREIGAERKRLRSSARRSFKDKGKLEQLFHEVYGQNPAPICGVNIGGYACSRKPDHKGPHLPQGATMRTRTRLPHNWQPRSKNPSAEALRERFTGTEADRTHVMQEPHMPAGDYAMLGKLLGLYVKPRNGGQVLMITGNGVTVVSDETARQIYFVGGDQDISSGLAAFGAVDRGGRLFELGEARRIDYQQRKEHVPHPESDQWRHEFGEESGVRPVVLYDANAKSAPKES
jgi:hypothetical protein